MEREKAGVREILGGAGGEGIMKKIKIVMFNIYLPKIWIHQKSILELQKAQF